MNQTANLAETLAQKAKATTPILRGLKEENRRRALFALEKHLLENIDRIRSANRLDLEDAKKNGLSAALYDRLLLTDARIQALSQTVREIAEAPGVVGATESSFVRKDGLEIIKQRIPIGVIGFIFESRPNVLVDSAALAIKSANAIILKGGKEARHSNQLLGELVKTAIATELPPDSIQVLPSDDRLAVSQLLVLNQLIDLIIPRGGEQLIQMVYEKSKIPVIAHYKGLCHIYLHKDAKEQDAINICLNAKTQRPGVCNAMETLLVHRDLTQSFLARLMHQFKELGVTLRGDTRLLAHFPYLEAASELDWETEYLDKILSIKLVDDEHEAIAHILRYGSHHTEGIVAEDPEVIQLFQDTIDASCITVNASTRFNDGGELGLGAEIGISTTKLHAYGPMGARELTTSRYIVRGTGHCRS
jgi:glutamate-5-semialdehyde dehydrogenase